MIFDKCISINTAGLRVSETISGTDSGGGGSGGTGVPPVSRFFLFDTLNPTGYAQVLEEWLDADNNGTLNAGDVQKSYTLGLDVISQTTATRLVTGPGTPDSLFLLYDAHGSTRGLLTAAGAIAQRFAFDAYGLQLQPTTAFALANAALTSLLYSGEWRSTTGAGLTAGLDYLRARWMNPQTGRFQSLDPYSGNSSK